MLRIEALCIADRYVRHSPEKSPSIKLTARVSAIPDSRSSSRVVCLALGADILLSSVLTLLRSDLYSLSFASKPALMLGCRLLASRSIFRICKHIKRKD